MKMLAETQRGGGPKSGDTRKRMGAARRAYMGKTVGQCGFLDTGTVSVLATRRVLSWDPRQTRWGKGRGHHLSRIDRLHQINPSRKLENPF